MYKSPTFRFCEGKSAYVGTVPLRITLVPRGPVAPVAPCGPNAACSIQIVADGESTPTEPNSSLSTVTMISDICYVCVI